MTDDFYRQLGKRFRGSRASVIERLQFYRPLLETQIAHTAPCKALDLGCGRGEWLELLIELGYEALGVEIDQAVLEESLTLGLPVTKADAMHTLEQWPTNSLSLVSAFHLIEHVSHEQRQSMAAQCYRILEPGGLLIWETPNPANLRVGTESFYLDPSHQSPLPHQLMKFLLEIAGFSYVKCIGLNHHSELEQTPEVSLYEVLAGTSPDYAVIGIKHHTEANWTQDLIAGFLEPTNGLSLEVLAKKYDDKYSSALRHLQSDVFFLQEARQSDSQELKKEQEITRQQVGEWREDHTNHLEQLKTALWDVKDQLSTEQATIRQELGDILTKNNQQLDVLKTSLFDAKQQIFLLSHELHQHRLNNRALNQQLRDVYASSSWTLTKPFRLIGRILKRIKSRLS